MPMPKPHDGEQQDEFISRCMGDELMNQDYEDGEQRAAVCYEIWRDRNKREERSMHKHITVPAEFKADGAGGRFSGYASIFENVDLGGDVVRKGAFKEIVTNGKGQVKVLFQHDSFGRTPSGGLPIGLATVEQNTKGLKFEGDLVMEDPFVQRVHTHMKAGTLDGMSIGYDVLVGGANIMESGYRELTGLKLWEISPVTFGMNPKAGITDVKSRGIMTLRDFEDFLSEALWDATALGRRPTRDDIKLLAARGWKDFESKRDASGAEDEEAAKVVVGLTDFFKARLGV